PKRYSSIDLKSYTSDFSGSNSIGNDGFAEAQSNSHNRTSIYSQSWVQAQKFKGV
ncbi:hypothetical protein FRX31_033958, partial [Thalictrum thalictroides]